MRFKNDKKKRRKRIKKDVGRVQLPEAEQQGTPRSNPPLLVKKADLPVTIRRVMLVVVRRNAR
jgi:hypothetical protein